MKPAGRFSKAIWIGPSNPSDRVAVNVSSRPLPGLTFGSFPPTSMLNDGCGERIVSV